MSRTQILFIKPTNSSFILLDQRILENNYTVETFLIDQGRNKWKYFFRLLEMTFFIIRCNRRSKAFVTWFGDYHAAVMVFVGRLFGKTTVIFAGGQESICYKELGKGVYLKRFRGACVRYAIRNAALVLPNHHSLIYHENRFYDEDKPHIDGLRHYVPDLKCRIEVVANGVDTERIDRQCTIEKESDLVLTVGTMNTTADFYNKGFDLFITAAKLCPDLRFVLIGIRERLIGWVEDRYLISKISNLSVISFFCSDSVLSDYFNRAYVYVQVSITEGMPVSLSEAMLCECIPVGSNVNGIPDAIGPHGIVITKRTPDDLRTGIRSAMKLNSGRSARQYTIDNYSISVREKRMMEVLRDFIS